MAARSGNVFLPLIAGLLADAIHAFHSCTHQRHPVRVLFRPGPILENLARASKRLVQGKKTIEDSALAG